MKRIQKVQVIVRSCLTGVAVWVYRGASEEAARIAYWRACQKELERVRQWPETVERRRAAIMRVLAEVTEGLPVTAEMPPGKRRFAKCLLAQAERKLPAGGEFYDHIMETRRRREEDRRIRQAMREREKERNTDYDK